MRAKPIFCLVASCVMAAMLQNNVEAFMVFGRSRTFFQNDAITSLSMAKAGKKKGGESGDSYSADAGWEPDAAMQALLDETEQRIGREADHWRSVKLMAPEEAAAKLDEEWLGAYTRYHAQFKEDMDSMIDIANLVAKVSQVSRILPKTKGQRKRDAWARKQARMGVPVNA
jgi:hypothetical protein